MDIVVKSALQKGILASSDVSRVLWDDGVAIDWRTLCSSMEGGQSRGNTDMRRADRDRADTLRRFAAQLYGFQAIVICEVGTLVLAHMLRHRLSLRIWRECFRLDCIPVAPHGTSLSTAGPVMLASPDPARAAARNFSRTVIPGESTLVYADGSVVSSLKSLLNSELKVVDSPVHDGSDGATGSSTSPYPAAA